MFANLSQKLSDIIKKLRNEAYLTEKNIHETMHQIKLALLEADVALSVTRSFLENIEKKAIGERVLTALSPGQSLISIVKKELTILIGGTEAIQTTEKNNIGLDLRSSPTIILLAGLQGVGKTTTAGKLANFLKCKAKKNVLTVSCDIYRPAAIEQLHLVTQQAGATWFESSSTENPLDIALKAMQHAHQKFYDILIIDTAGRLSFDDIMMNEIAEIQNRVRPHETLYIVDAMQGQAAVNTAKNFNQKLKLTGIVLSKLDGDARGGAALSVYQETKKPIKFIGISEKINGIELFNPERMANRILGMGDILSLIEETQRNIDPQTKQKITDSFRAGKSFNLNHFAEHLKQVQQHGGISSIFEKLPTHLKHKTSTHNMEIAELQIRRMRGIIHAMTTKERLQPDIIKASRKRRIAHGSGVSVQDVNRMIAQFENMRDIMKKINTGGMGKVLRNIRNLMPH